MDLGQKMVLFGVHLLALNWSYSRLKGDQPTLVFYSFDFSEGAWFYAVCSYDYKLNVLCLSSIIEKLVVQAGKSLFPLPIAFTFWCAFPIA